MARFVNTDVAVDLEDVARFLGRCQQPRMAAAVRATNADLINLRRQYHALLDDNRLLRHRIEPQLPPVDPTHCRSEWE